jgi:hypothetical protein
MHREKKIRKIQTIKKGVDTWFFDWDLEKVKYPLKGGYHSLVGEAFRAANIANIGISYNEQGIVIWSVEDRRGKVCKRGDVTKTVSVIFEKRHYEALIKQPSRDRPFITFTNSKISNYFIGNCKSLLSDGFIRFALRARNDTLWTPARKAFIYKNQYDSPNCQCGNHRFCNLLHILNNCSFSGSLMTERHDAVQLRLVEAIKKCRNIQTDDIHNNERMKFNPYKDLDKKNVSPFSLLRPDMFFWDDVETEDKSIKKH